MFDGVNILVGWRNVVRQTMESHGGFLEIDSTCTARFVSRFERFQAVQVFLEKSWKGTQRCRAVRFTIFDGGKMVGVGGRHVPALFACSCIFCLSIVCFSRSLLVHALKLLRKMRGTEGDIGVQFVFFVVPRSFVGVRGGRISALFVCVRFFLYFCLSPLIFSR